MQTDKEVKKEFKVIASKSPDSYYATNVLKEEGFRRKQCKCGTFFWSINADQTHCGDPECSGGFRFFEGNPAKNKLTYTGVWNEFSKFFNKRGYTPIKRYPVTARWREDTDFVQASIYDFQPYVVSGEVEPPANPLVVPQFCLRFNDIDNVGITGAHYTGFVMIGQHAFTAPDKFDQKKYFQDIHDWQTKGLGIPKNEITYHEDAWAGGGNFGPCMEFFSRGLELGNQVYMLYEKTPVGKKDLKIKVLDMGMGHERNSWFTNATATSYETTFPDVCKFLYKNTGIKPDNILLKKFLPYASYLNVDEVEDIDKSWKFVAKKVDQDVESLKKEILPLAGLYSVGEHTRSLLVALSDGALPSNVGGGYNLRVILRRALTFNAKYGWNIELPKIAELHADELKGLFPELKEHVGEVSDILENEKQKFDATRLKTRQIVENILKNKNEITQDELIKQYDSNGIDPELISDEAKKLGKTVVVPDDFYIKVAERHDKQEQVHQTKKEDRLDLTGVQDTVAEYYDDYEKHEFSAKVIKIIDKFVVLSNTAFYPTSGGQIHDIGTINKENVTAVFKQGGVIVHAMENIPRFKVDDKVEGVVEKLRRKQLAQHHSATHIVNAAAKKVLGSHINQAGAKKDTEKAHLDITHYKNVDDEELKKIEFEANRIVQAKIPIELRFYSRTDAEKNFGMSIYQGGVVPGKKLRIVNIKGIDVEACGGTHCKNTSEVGEIKLLKSTKIQDGIVRLVYTAGSAKNKTDSGSISSVSDICEILCLSKEDYKKIPARSQELFDKWKKVRKAAKKAFAVLDASNPAYSPDDIVTEKDFKLSSNETNDISISETLKYSAKLVSSQPDHLANTLRKFKMELDTWHDEWTKKK